MLKYVVVIALVVMALAVDIFGASLADSQGEEALPLEQTPADDRSLGFMFAVGAGMKKFFKKIFFAFF